MVASLKKNERSAAEGEEEDRDPRNCKKKEEVLKDAFFPGKGTPDFHNHKTKSKNPFCVCGRPGLGVCCDTN